MPITELRQNIKPDYRTDPFSLVLTASGERQRAVPSHADIGTSGSTAQPTAVLLPPTIVYHAFQADEALEGDLSGVTNSLGLAFNSTLIALVLSIILMFVMHLLQARKEHLIQDVQEYCRTKIVDAMKVPAGDDAGATFV